MVGVFHRVGEAVWRRWQLILRQILELAVGIVLEGSVGIDGQQRAGRQSNLAADVRRFVVDRRDRQRGSVDVGILAFAVVGQHVAADGRVFIRGNRIVERRRHRAVGDKGAQGLGLRIADRLDVAVDGGVDAQVVDEQPRFVGVVAVVHDDETELEGRRRAVRRIEHPLGGPPSGGAETADVGVAGQFVNRGLVDTGDGAGNGEGGEIVEARLVAAIEHPVEPDRGSGGDGAHRPHHRAVDRVGAGDLACQGARRQSEPVRALDVLDLHAPAGLQRAAQGPRRHQHHRRTVRRRERPDHLTRLGGRDERFGLVVFGVEPNIIEHPVELVLIPMRGILGNQRRPIGDIPVGDFQRNRDGRVRGRRGLGEGLARRVLLRRQRLEDLLVVGVPAVGAAAAARIRLGLRRRGRRRGGRGEIGPAGQRIRLGDDDPFGGRRRVTGIVAAGPGLELDQRLEGRRAQVVGPVRRVRRDDHRSGGAPGRQTVENRPVASDDLVDAHRAMDLRRGVVAVGGDPLVGPLERCGAGAVGDDQAADRAVLVGQQDDLEVSIGAMGYQQLCPLGVDPARRGVDDQRPRRRPAGEGVGSLLDGELDRGFRPGIGRGHDQTARGADGEQHRVGEGDACGAVRPGLDDIAREYGVAGAELDPGAVGAVDAERPADRLDGPDRRRTRSEKGLRQFDRRLRPGKSGDQVSGDTGAARRRQFGRIGGGEEAAQNHRAAVGSGSDQIRSGAGELRVEQLKAVGQSHRAGGRHIDRDRSPPCIGRRIACPQHRTISSRSALSMGLRRPWGTVFSSVYRLSRRRGNIPQKG